MTTNHFPKKHPSISSSNAIFFHNCSVPPPPLIFYTVMLELFFFYVCLFAFFLLFCLLACLAIDFFRILFIPIPPDLLLPSYNFSLKDKCFSYYIFLFLLGFCGNFVEVVVDFRLGAFWISSFVFRFFKVLIGETSVCLIGNDYFNLCGW